MKWMKILYAGVLTSIISYLINSGFGIYFQDLYDPTSGLWRAMMTPIWYQNVIISTVIISFLFVIVYAFVNTALGKKKEWAKKGLLFGFLIWLVRDITGAAMTYAFMPVSLFLVGNWLISGIIISLINGLVVARIYR